jgi:hypothetical protein
MMILMIIVVVVPGILVNRWLSAKEKQRKQRGFEVFPLGKAPSLKQKEDDHG